MLTDEYWVKLKPVMLELGVYAKPQPNKPSKEFFIGYGWDVPGGICLKFLVAGMPSIYALVS